MKTLYLLLLFSAIGLSATATNNNAGKLIRVQNKAIKSYHTSLLPSHDGGAYMIYEPYVMTDSFLVTRFNADGTVAWTKALLHESSMLHNVVTPDNGIVLLTQDFTFHDRAGLCAVKLAADGSVVFKYDLNNTGMIFCSAAASNDGTVTISVTGSSSFSDVSTFSYVISPLGVLSTLGIQAQENLYSQANFFSSAISTADGRHYVTTLSDNKRALIKTNGATKVWAKKYTTPGTYLTTYKILRLSDGNILMCGGNSNQDSAFVAKIDDSNGQMLWLKRYNVSFPSLTASVSGQTIKVDVGAFTDMAELADGSIMLGGVGLFRSLTSGEMSNDCSIVTHLNADGSAVGSYYIGGNISSLTDSTMLDHEGFSYNIYQNLNSDGENHFLSLMHNFPDHNNVMLLPVTDIPNLCGVKTGSTTVTDLTVSATEDISISTTLGATPSAYSSNIVDVTTEFTTTDVCLSNQAATGIHNLQLNNSISITPNPATPGGDILVTVADITGAERLNILDVTGKLLLSQQGVSAQNTLSLQGIAAGSYILQLTGKQTVSKQFLVTK